MLDERFFALNEDKPHEECGIFGIFDSDGFDVARMTYYALYALQHRGQESCGIAVIDRGEIFHFKDKGLVPDVFTDIVLSHLKGGNMGIGHVRYSAAGDTSRENAQPLVAKYKRGMLAVAHNGCIWNAKKLRKNIEDEGSMFHTTSDAEVIAQILARERIKVHTIEDALVNTMEMLKGAFTLAILSPNKLVFARDSRGFRPLVLGKVKNSYVVASETCALDAVNAEFIRDVEPGEIIVIDKKGVKSIKTPQNKSSLCIFEHIYFARPDSVIDGQSVYESRKEAGRLLAKEHPIDADVVIGVPDSGLIAAMGYAEQSKIPYDTGLIKNRYIGRTFIQPEQSQREQLVKIKLNALESTIKGKRIIMIDDSIVRGTTGARIVNILRDAGAKEVHLLISSPPFLHPCYYGTDIPTKEHLFATNRTIEEMRQIIGVDSLGFLNLEDLSALAQNSNLSFCDACFSGKYKDK